MGGQGRFKPESRSWGNDRALEAALARTDDTLATLGAWGPSRRAAVRRVLGDMLTALLRDIERGTKSVAQAANDVRYRIDGRGPPPARDPGAAAADELLLNFLLAMKARHDNRLRGICESIFETIHRFVREQPTPYGTAPCANVGGGLPLESRHAASSTSSPKRHDP